MHHALALNRRTLLGALLTLPWAEASLARASLPAMELASDAPPNVDPLPYLVSEKYDGVRALWDGQHLRFRSGLPVPAPGWFLAPLPAGQVLDGELWCGRGCFERLSGTVRTQQAQGAAWQQVRFMVFDLPGHAGTFAQRQVALERLLPASRTLAVQAVAQNRISTHKELQAKLAEVVQGGGEGLVLHLANALHQPGRSGQVLKLKPWQDAEAVVLGHVEGRGKHQGRLGALRVRNDQGAVFLIGTGFSDAQRESPPAVGAVVTYTHQGLTATGLPRFASFLRVREVW